MATTITIRSDAEVEHALDVLGSVGSRSELIRPPGRGAEGAMPTTLGAAHAATIHLGTALHARGTLTWFVTCDKHLLDAARAAGLPTGAPS
jgi:predicted transcriptional regulator